jgi:hypothetical protein
LAALLPLDKIVLLPNSSEPSSILPLLFLSKTSKPSSLPTQPLCSAKLLLSWTYSNSNEVDSSNNAHKQQGSFTTTAGTDNKMNDVWFDVDNFRKVA